MFNRWRNEAEKVKSFPVILGSQEKIQIGKQSIFWRPAPYCIHYWTLEAEGNMKRKEGVISHFDLVTIFKIKNILSPNSEAVI